MKIGIFGGTFNPIHNGHIEMIKLVKEKQKLDQVFVVPSFQTSDKLFQIEKISAKDRFKMVAKTVKGLNLGWLKVSDFEYKQKGISYTHKTIKHFKETNPNDELYWIIGEDRYEGFKNWQNVDYIKENAKVIIFRRKEKMNPRLLKDKEFIVQKDVYFDISSSMILSEIRWDLIPEPAKAYIAKNKLYLKTLVFNVLKYKRYEHSVAVASHAKRLSMKYGYRKVNKAILVGLVHDLFKLHDEDFLRGYLSKHAPEILEQNIPTPALHGFVVAVWLRDEYGWKDKEVFNALSSHTLASGGATKLDKIIYVADKISSDRKGHKVGKLRKLAYLSLDQTYIKILKQSVKKLKKQKISVHVNTADAYREHIQPKYGLNKYDFELKENNKTQPE